MENNSLQLILDNIYDRCMYNESGVKRDPENINRLLSKYVGSLESLLILFMNTEYKEQIINILLNQLEDINATPTPSIQQSENYEEESSFY